MPLVLEPYLDDGDVTLYCGDALETLRELPTGSVDMVATSPPFYGLRDYGTGEWEGGDEGCDHQPPKQPGRSFDNGQGESYTTNNQNWSKRDETAYGQTCGKCGARRVDRQIGLEETPDQWVTNLVQVFRECRRVLADHGTLWVEIGDSYGEKQLIGQPWTLAFALRADGWYLRSEIIWARPNPMPESVTDRPTKAHSTVFLLAKGGKWKTRIVECANLPSECLHLGADLSAKSPDLVAGDFSVRLATAILDSAKAHDDLGLGSLDSEVGQEHRAGVGGPTVADLPVEHWATVLASRLLRSEIPPKEFLCELHRRGITLTDGDQLLVGDGLPLVPLPLGVTRYGEASIAVHHPGEVRQLDLRHNRIILSTPPTSCSYFYDADAIRETTAPGTLARFENGAPRKGRSGEGYGIRPGAAVAGAEFDASAGANARSVWTIPTQPTPFAHFATWPQKLVARMIQAGTSERGCCPECGKPWVRDVEHEYEHLATRRSTAQNQQNSSPVGNIGALPTTMTKHTKTLGWSPSCHHTSPPVPCLVLDPFAGSGTTLLVARHHGRHAIGIELNPDYCHIAAKQLQQLSLLT